MDQYFTSENAANTLIQTVLSFSHGDVLSVCDPCAGSGSLTNAFIKQRPDATVYAYDIDNKLCEKHGWIHQDFLTTEPVKVDVVICNPPFSSGRDEKANGRRGQDLSLAFLSRCCKWAPLLGFIMHQNKGNPTFSHQIWTEQPNLSLIHHSCIDKRDSVFNVGKKIKFVPCAIYIYRIGKEATPEPVLHKSIVCDDLEFLDLNDKHCNIIVKSWGSPNRIGRLVTINENVIMEETSKLRKKPGKHGVNMHFFSKDTKRSIEIMERMIPDIAQLVAYARDCSNVKITPAQFIFLYNKHK